MTASRQEPAGWLESLSAEHRVKALAALRRLAGVYEPATAGELLALLRQWAYAGRHAEEALAVAVLVGLRTDRPDAVVLAEAVLAERRAERRR